MSKARAVTISRPGGPEVLTVTEREVRRAGAGEVRIAVKASAVNPTDIMMRQNFRGQSESLPIQNDGAHRNAVVSG